MTKKHFLYLGTIILIFGALIPFLRQTLSFVKMFEQLGAEIRSVPFKLEDSTIRTFNLTTNKYDSIQFEGATLIHFWASWCLPCITEYPHLEAFKHREPQIRILQFSFDNREELVRVINKYEWKLPSYQLTDTSIFEEPELLPTTYLLRNDTVLKIYYGAQQWDSLNVKKLFHDLESYTKFGSY